MEGRRADRKSGAMASPAGVASVGRGSGVTRRCERRASSVSAVVLGIGSCSVIDKGRRNGDHSGAPRVTRPHRHGTDTDLGGAPRRPGRDHRQGRQCQARARVRVLRLQSRRGRVAAGNMTNKLRSLGLSARSTGQTRSAKAHTAVQCTRGSTRKPRQRQGDVGRGKEDRTDLRSTRRSTVPRA